MYVNSCSNQGSQQGQRQGDKMKFFKTACYAIPIMMIAMLVFKNPASAADQVLRVCAGSPTGNYTFAANEISKRLNGVFTDVEIIETGGSLDNLRRLMAGDCDMGIVQSDVNDLFRMENPKALGELDKFANLYTEYVHVLCPVNSDWDSISDVGNNNGKLIVGPDGGGSAETWRALRTANTAYDKSERIPDSVGIEAARKVKDSNDTCMLWVSGLNSPDMQAANLMSVNTRDREPALRLIDVDDSDFKEIKGSDGAPMYHFEKIIRRDPGQKPGVYNNLIDDGWGEDSVEVPTVDALLIARKDFKMSNSVSSRLVIAIEDASPTIWNRTNPTQ